MDKITLVAAAECVCACAGSPNTSPTGRLYVRRNTAIAFLSSAVPVPPRYPRHPFVSAVSVSRFPVVLLPVVGPDRNGLYTVTKAYR